MPLVSLNLADIIAEYNQAHGTRYSIDTVTALARLNPTLFASLNQRIAALEQAHELFIFTDSERQSHQQLQQHWLHALKLAKPSSTAAGEQAVSPKIQQKYQYYQWQQKQYAKLQQESTWRVLQKKVIAQYAWQKLRAEWQQQQFFVRCSHEAIGYLYQEILPSLKIMLQTLLRRWQRQAQRIPLAIFRQVHEMLQQNLHAVADIQSQLIDTMLGRLRALDGSEGEHSEVMLHMVTRMRNLGALPRYFQLPAAPTVLTDEQFAYYQHVILRDGNTQQYQQWLQLSWLQPASQIAVVHDLAQSTRVVPKALKPWIPRHRLIPAWLFSGHNFRYQFFADQVTQLLLFDRPVKRALPHVMTLEKITERLADYQRQDENIQQLSQRLQQPDAVGMQAWYHYRSRTMLAKWRVSLQDKMKQLMMARIELAQYLLNDIKEQERRYNFSHLPWQKITLLETLLQQLHQQQSIYLSSVEQQAQLNLLEQQAKAVLIANKACQHVRRLAQGRAVTSAECQFLINYYTACQLHDQSSSRAFIQLCRSKHRAMLQAVKTRLKGQSGLPESLTELHAYLQQTVPMLHWLRVVDERVFMQELQSAMVQCFIQYLQFLLRPAATISQPIKSAWLEILAFFAEQCVVDHKTLDHYLQEVRQLENQQLHTAVKIKCHCLLTRLNNDLLPRRFARDLHLLEQRALDKLTATFHYSAIQINELLAIRQTMLNHKVTDIDMIMPRLDRYQVTILQGDNTRRAAANDFLQLTTKGRLLQQQLAQHHLSSADKQSAIKQFQQTVKSHQVTKASVLLAGPILWSRSGRRELFTKSYVNHALVSPLPRLFKP